MKRNINLTIAIAIGFMMSGCSYLGFGENQTYCQEHGRNFKDAGVCGDTYEIYRNIGKVRKISYRDYEEQSNKPEKENLHKQHTTRVNARRQWRTK